MTLIRWIDVKACISFSQRFSKRIGTIEESFLGTIKRILLLGIKLHSRYRAMLVDHSGSIFTMMTSVLISS